MSKKDLIRVLGCWEGYSIGSVERVEATKSQPIEQVRIELVALPAHPLVCSGCGEVGHPLHDTAVRWVRDLPILGAQTHLKLHRRRVACPTCGPKLEALVWLGRYARVTQRLAESVARLCSILPIKHVAQFYGLDRKTVKTIDKRFLESKLGPVDLTDVAVIAMDEFSIHKGHRYATIVVEPYRKKVLWVGRGRSRRDVRPFFELLGEEGCRALRAVVMDMSAAYKKEVYAHCPHAEIVYDLFHVVAKYGREVIDRVRVDEANRLKGDKAARRVVKGSKWLLLRNRENINTEKDRVRLSELLAANKSLTTVYILKEDLKHLWDFRSQREALAFWKHWHDRAMRSNIAPLKRFARNLKDYLVGILAHSRWPLHTSLLEGINNKIKVIKRMAYGFRDDEYFFLKIRAAFPGIGS